MLHSRSQLVCCKNAIGDFEVSLLRVVGREAKNLCSFAKQSMACASGRRRVKLIISSSTSARKAHSYNFKLFQVIPTESAPQFSLHHPWCLSRADQFPGLTNRTQNNRARKPRDQGNPIAWLNRIRRNSEMLPAVRGKQIPSTHALRFCSTIPIQGDCTIQAAQSLLLYSPAQDALAWGLQEIAQRSCARLLTCANR